jgi:hypothetical protein
MQNLCDIQHAMAAHRRISFPVLMRERPFMKSLRLVTMLMGLATLSVSASAQKEFYNHWENRVRSTMAQQPPWPVPLFAPTSNLSQLFRYDIVRQIAPAGTSTWNYGFGKGLNLTPWYNTEVDVTVPPYIEHNSTAHDGFGDFSTLLKYRFAAGNLEHGDYSVAASLTVTFPTGSYKNGARHPTVGPTLHAGKGFKNFDVITSVGATLPTADSDSIGRMLAWNVVGQYRIHKRFWPEIENNATFFHAGPNDGRVQNFVSPGIVVSPLKLSSDPKSRLGLILGIGEQIATTHFHLYNHALILDARFVF